MIKTIPKLTLLSSATALLLITCAGCGTGDINVVSLEKQGEKVISESLEVSTSTVKQLDLEPKVLIEESTPDEKVVELPAVGEQPLPQKKEEMVGFGFVSEEKKEEEKIVEKQDCVIKGNISSKKEKIYHYPGCQSYSRTKISIEKGEKWFCTKESAEAAGWRVAKNC